MFSIFKRKVPATAVAGGLAEESAGDGRAAAMLAKLPPHLDRARAHDEIVFMRVAAMRRAIRSGLRDAGAAARLVVHMDNRLRAMQPGDTGPEFLAAVAAREPHYEQAVTATDGLGPSWHVGRLLAGWLGAGEDAAVTTIAGAEFKDLYEATVKRLRATRIVFD